MNHNIPGIRPNPELTFGEFLDKYPDSDLRELQTNKFTFPGGYPLYPIMDDGEMLCRTCFEEPEVHIGGEADGWRVETLEILWENDPEYGPAQCAHCGIELTPAYE